MLELAIKLAREMKQKFNVVCIIVDKKYHILSIGTNSFTKSHTRQAYYARRIGNKVKIFLHAEIDSLIKCQGEPYAMFIARVKKDGTPALAKPCLICQGAIKDAGIQKVYYTNDIKTCQLVS